MYYIEHIAARNAQETNMSNHRFFQLANLVDTCEADARLNFRAAKSADSIKNRTAAAYFRARATKALRVAQIAALRAGL
jgi:hypothetical protein